MQRLITRYCVIYSYYDYLIFLIRLFLILSGWNLLGMVVFFGNYSVQAEIIPDNTLNSENSQIERFNNQEIIRGGAIRGTKLFHSFQEFSIPALREVYFANPEGITNIISRVTGNNSSQISGRLGVLGNANLFLINPQGIIFNRDGSLAVQGNFIATTATSLVFDNGWEFSATNPQAPPLLTMNVPIGLQMGANPGQIINQSQATSALNLPANFPQLPTGNKAGLQVAPGQFLGLIGGDIQLDGGGLTAISGQVTLASVKSPSLILLNPTPTGLNLDLTRVQSFGDINLANNSLVNTSGIGGGQINLYGRDINLTNSRIHSLGFGDLDVKSIDIRARNLFVTSGSQISTFNLGNGRGRDINIQAEDAIAITGLGSQGYRAFLVNYLTSGPIDIFDPQLMLTTGSAGTGSGGDINLAANRLLLADGAINGTGSFGIGNAGDVTIRTNYFELIGSAMNSITTPISQGNGGNIDIQTQWLVLRDEAVIGNTNTGVGAGGNINIRASESVELLRTPENAVIQTAISTNAFNLSGGAGNIFVDTKKLTIRDGAGISSSNGILIGNNFVSNGGGVGGNLEIRASKSVEVTGISQILANGGITPSFLAAQAGSTERGGDINIFTSTLTVGNGGLISAASWGFGDAGNVEIQAEQVDVFGSALDGLFPSKIEVSSGLIDAVVNPNAFANAGSLKFRVNNLNIRDRAVLSVQALGSAKAGNINAVANQINMDNQARIDAATVSGVGGNINLLTRNLFLRRQSNIRTDAGSGNGGNINIDSRLIMAIPKENSDITANAIAGDGGKINITTQGILGFQLSRNRSNNQFNNQSNNRFANQQDSLLINPLQQTNNQSEISASSLFGVNGVVAIDTVKTEPTVRQELPTNTIATSSQIRETCSNIARTNSFQNTGRGGIQPIAKEALNQIGGWSDWRFSQPNGSEEVQDINTNVNREKYKYFHSAYIPLVEANQIIVDKKGTVKLVANFTNIYNSFTVNNRICN